MEPILDYVKRKLRDAGPKRWPAIAALTGSNFHAMRKIAYNDVKDPGVLTVQPLVDFFHAVDAGRRELPAPVEAEQKPAPEAA